MNGHSQVGNSWLMTSVLEIQYFGMKTSQNLCSFWTMGLRHLWSYPVHWGRDEIINYPVAVIKPPSLGMSRQAYSRRGSLNNSFTQEQTQAFSMKPSHKTASQWAKTGTIPGGRSWHLRTPLLPWPSRIPKARSLSLPSPAVRTMSRNRICVFHHSIRI